MISFLNYSNGDLTSWAKQGVLLLNSTLTVRLIMDPHQNKGWEKFTDKVILIQFLKKKRCYFSIWGKCKTNEKYILY